MTNSVSVRGTKRVASQAGRRGQSIIFVTLSLPVLFGLLSLVVDIGWAYWRQEACTTAAQSAAVAAGLVAEANAANGCGNGSKQVPSQSLTACPSTLSGTNPLQAGCMYAKQNGFVNGGNNNRQSVSMASGCSSSPVSGVTPSYWITASVSEQIPGLFSAILGHPWLTVSA